MNWLSGFMGRCIEMSSESKRIVSVLIEEGIAARSHFQVWWALRNTALPRFLETMNNENYVEFFMASNSAHYKQFLLALSKIFDRDSRVAGISELKRALKAVARDDLAERVETVLSPHHQTISALIGIRSQSLVHNERNLSRNDVYKINGITPNQVEALIDTTCSVVNEVAIALGISNAIYESNRLSRATIRLLEALERGKI